MRAHPLAFSLFTALLIAGCAEAGGSTDPARPAGEQEAATEAPLIEAPFTIDEQATGLLFVYFNEDGTRSVERLADVPEAHREYVRVDSLSLAPEDRLAPGLVYVADLRAPRGGGGYGVRRMSREAFDALVDRAIGYEPPSSLEPREATAGEQVVLYGASWCGACRSANAFLRGAGIPFIERDIERDPGAREEMVAKLRAAGRPPGGIPVIDFRGTIVEGFDRGTLERLAAETASP